MKKRRTKRSNFYGCFEKVLRMMKLTALLLFTGLMSVSASIYSQATKLTMDLENVSIIDVFSQIEQNSEFVFIYKNGVVDFDKRVNVKVKGSTVDVILDELFRESGIKYEILNKQIILTPERSIPSRQVDLTEEVDQLSPPPGKMLSGSVTDSKGEPIPGASIVVKGTTIGTVTDVDGKFMLQTPESAKVLSISFVGFTTQEIQIGAQTNFKIALKESTVGVEEVVIVGYGQQKKETLVGAVSNVKSDELEKTGAMSNLAQALTGQLAGLTTILSSGEPGNDDPTILIRGKSTWNEASPLVLVDGIERKMNDLDVKEVESVSILKDASATAMFGVKGAEGVILITTKRGKIGKPQLSVDGDFGVKFLSRTPDKLDAYEGLKLRNYAIENELPTNEAGWGNYIPTAQLNRYKKPQAEGDEYLFPNVDWPEEMLNDFATTKRVNINISGGTKFAKYFGSLSYLTEGDLLKSGMDNGKGYKTKWGYNRFNYRTNIDFNLTPTTVLSANLSGYVGTKFEGYSTADGTGTLFRAFYNTAPSAFPVQYADGVYGYTVDFSNESNPVATLNNGGLEKITRSQVNTDFKLTQKLDFITKGLEVQASLSYDNLFYTSGGIFEVSNTLRKYVDPDIIEVLPGGVYSEEAIAALPAAIRDMYVTYSPSQGTNYFDYYQQPVSYLAEGVRSADYWNTNNYLEQIERRLFYQFQINYARQFGRHDLTATALMNREEYAQGSMFPTYREDWVSRITYNYDGKYLFETNGAYNGSEKFADKYRFGFFPSVAIGWVASNENLLKKYDWLDLLKFRYSVGKVGNDKFASARWAYETSWKIDSPNTPFGYPSYGLSPYTQTIESVIGNPDLHWEESTKQNLGIELGLLNMVTLNAEFFTDHREDIFMSASQRHVAAYFGALPVAANLGETKTKGFELELKFQKTTRQGLNYWVEWDYTRAIDEVVYMEDPELTPDYQKNAGFQIEQTKAIMSDGILTNWDDVYSSTTYAALSNKYKLPGDYKIIDFNADGQIDSYDMAPYGYPLRPQNTYNFELGFSHKGFSAYVQFYGVYNVTREVYLTPWGDATAQLAYSLQSDYFTAENADASYKGVRYKTDASTYNGTFYMFDGSYLRLKTAEVSYRFTGAWLKSLGLSSARVYLNGNNLWFWSDMPDDRESNTSRVTYPTYKRVNLGINLNF